MGPLPSADLTPAYPGVAPLGLGTGDVESFTGYVVRLGNAFAVPASVLLTHSLNAVLPPARRDLHYRRNSEIESALGLSGAVPAQPKGPRAKRSTFKPGRRAPARAPVGVPPEASVTRRSAA